MASGRLFWLLDGSSWVPARRSDGLDPVYAADFAFTIEVLYGPGDRADSVASEGGLGGNLTLQDASSQDAQVSSASETPTKSPSRVPIDRLREIAADRIEWLVERVFADQLGGLDLGPWVRGLSVVDELAAAMASGIPASVHVAARPTPLPVPGGAESGSPLPAGTASPGGDTGFFTLDEEYEPNDPPYAFGEGYLTAHDQTLEVSAPGILENDWDPEGGDVFAVEVLGPEHADFFDLRSDGSFTYTPSEGYVGEDWFAYQVSDGVNLSEDFAITRIGVFNTPPFAIDDPDAADQYIAVYNTLLEVEAPGVLYKTWTWSGTTRSPRCWKIRRRTAPSRSTLRARSSTCLRPTTWATTSSPTPPTMAWKRASPARCG